MTRQETYQKLKDLGLCVDCKERAEPGKTRCLRCLHIIAAKERFRREDETPEHRKKRMEYHKNWQETHPENMKKYKSRKSEYNRRYRNGFTL